MRIKRNYVLSLVVSFTIRDCFVHTGAGTRGVNSYQSFAGDRRPRANRYDGEDNHGLCTFHSTSSGCRFFGSKYGKYLWSGIYLTFGCKMDAEVIEI